MSHYETRYQQIPVNELVRLRNQANSAIELQRINAELARRTAVAEQASQAAEARARTLQNNINTLNSNIRDLGIRNNELANAIRNTNEQLAQAHREHEQYLSAMRNTFTTRLQQTDAENRQRLQQLENTFWTNLDRTEREMRADFSNAIAHAQADLQHEISENTQRLNNRITAVHNYVDRQIREVNASIVGLETQMDAVVRSLQNRQSQETELHNQAVELYNAAQAIIAQTDAYNAENQHNWHSEDRAALAQRAQGVRQDIEGGATTASAARAGGRDMLREALAFRERVFEDEMRWVAERELTSNVVLEAGASCDSHARVEIGGEMVDVDYWTCGELGRIRGCIDALNAQLQNPRLTSEQMENIRALALQYRQEVSDSVDFAVNAVQLSFDREDLLHDAVDMMRDQYLLEQEWAEHYADDKRLGFRVYLTNRGNGMELVLTGEPMPGENGEIQNVYHSEILRPARDMRNAETVAQFNRDLMRDLNNETGAVFGDSTCSSPDQPVEDVGQTDQNSYVNVPREEHVQVQQQQATPRLNRRQAARAAGAAANR